MKAFVLLKLGRLTIAWTWYDLWIGFYIDRDNKIIYFCPLPTLLFKIKL